MANQYKTIEVGWVGDFHPGAMNLYKSLGFKIVQEAHTLRKIFNPNRPFQRAARIGVKNGI